MLELGGRPNALLLQRPDGSLQDATEDALSVIRAAMTDLGLADDVLLSASAPRTADLLSAHGLRPHPIPLASFEAMEAGPTCLSVVVRDEPA